MTASGAATSGNHLVNKTYVDTQIGNLIGAAPATMDTLAEIAAWVRDGGDASNLVGQLATVTNSVSTEVTRATAAEATLTTSVSTEVTRATAAEATLTTSVSNEVTRATAAEATLTTSVTALNTTTGTHTTAIAALNTTTGTHTTAIAAHDTAISALSSGTTSATNGEIARATAAEAALTVRINALYQYFFQQQTVPT